jgi:hypothetical protein
LLLCILVLSSLRAVILFLLKWILDPNAKNSQEECLEAKVADLVAEEPREHVLRRNTVVEKKSRKKKRPKGRHKAVIASGSIIKRTENLDTPLDSLSQISKQAVTPALLFQDDESLDIPLEANSLDAALMASAMASINIIRAVMPSLASLRTALYFKGENISAFLES